MKDTNKTKKYTRFPSVLATSIYRSCSARSRSKHGTKDENSFTFDTTTIHPSTHPLIDQPTNFVKSTVFPIKINACTRRHFNLMRYFSAHKPFLSLDQELTLFYPCHNNKNKNKKKKENPHQNLSEGGCTRRLKFDTQTTHGLLAEFRGLARPDFPHTQKKMWS